MKLNEKGDILTEEEYKLFISRKNLITDRRIRPDNQSFFDAISTTKLDENVLDILKNI